MEFGEINGSGVWVWVNGCVEGLMVVGNLEMVHSLG